MPTVVKIQKRGQVTIPARLRTRVGILDGDLVEAVLSRGKIILTPKAVIDRSKLRTASGEYTTEQRRIIDAGIAQGLEDFKNGRSHGPFASAEEASAYIDRIAKQDPATKRKPRLR